VTFLGAFCHRGCRGSFGVSECNYGCVTVQAPCVWLGRLWGTDQVVSNIKDGAFGLFSHLLVGK
jgi:hypothetical protein